MDAALETLKKRYFREKDQKFCHFGDCSIYASFRGICTCGLIDWVYPYVYGSDEEVDDFFGKYYPGFEKDFEKHNLAIGCLEKNLEAHKEEINKWINSEEYKKIIIDI